MAEILFVTWDGGGNVPPALAIARQLQARGHTVRFLGHRGQREALAEFEVEPNRHARRFSRLDGGGPVTMLATLGDRGMGEDLRAALARRPADLVVVDCLMLGALAAAHADGVPYAVLEHFPHTAFARMQRSPLGLVMALRGLHPRQPLASARAVIATTLPALDEVPAGKNAAGNVVQVGPVVDWAPRGEEAGRRTGRPVVLVSASTFGFAGLRESVQRQVDASATVGARVVLTTGPALDPAALRLPPHVEAHRFVPHKELMRSASLFVGHGGHGSTMAALAHDLPMVLVPMDTETDQPAVARAVEQAGAGRALPRRAGVDRIAEAVAAMLAGGQHREAAARLGEQVRAMPGDVLGADAVEAVLTPASSAG